MIFRKMQIHYSSLETWFVLFVHRDIGCNVVQQQTIQLYSYNVSIRWNRRRLIGRKIVQWNA